MRFFESDEPGAAGAGAAGGIAARGGAARRKERSGSCRVVDGVNSGVFAAVSFGVDSGGESDVSSGVNARATGPRRTLLGEAHGAPCSTKGRRVSYLALPRNRSLAA